MNRPWPVTSFGWIFALLALFLAVISIFFAPAVIPHFGAILVILLALAILL